MVIRQKLRMKTPLFAIFLLVIISYQRLEGRSDQCTQWTSWSACVRGTRNRFGHKSNFSLSFFYQSYNREN